MAKIIKNAAITHEISPMHQVPETRIIPQTVYSESQIERLQEESYQQGYEAGKKEGLKLNSDYLTPLKNQWEELLNALPDALSQQRMLLQQEVADIVLLITSQYFMNEASNPKHLEQQITQILTQLNSRETIELYLHPKDIQLLQEEAFVLQASFVHGIKIKSDESLTLGGCRIKTSHGVFNASIEQQIDQLKEALLKLKQGGTHASLV